MANFQKDHDEYYLIDQYATAYQQKYGIPNYNEVQWNSRDVPWKEHIKKLDEDVFGITPNVKTSIPKPKEKKSVAKEEKREITHNII